MQKKGPILWKTSSMSIQKTYLSLHTATFKLKTAWSIPPKGSIHFLIFTFTLILLMYHWSESRGHPQ